MFLISYCSREFSSVDKHNICEVCVRTLKKKKKNSMPIFKIYYLEYTIYKYYSDIIFHTDYLSNKMLQSGS